MSSQGVAVARGYPSWDRACYTGIRGRQAPGSQAGFYRELRRKSPGTGAGPTGIRGGIYRDWGQKKSRKPSSLFRISDRNFEQCSET